MSDDARSCPLTVKQALDLYFIEHRAKLLDVAALLDRLGRAQDSRGVQDSCEVDDASLRHADARLAALHQALRVLGDGQGDYARRLQMSFSDLTTDLYPPGTRGPAVGTYVGA